MLYRRTAQKIFRRIVKTRNKSLSLRRLVETEQTVCPVAGRDSNKSAMASGTLAGINEMWHIKSGFVALLEAPA